jgi:hypothetical protein
MDQSQEKSANLMDALYDKLGEAVDLAEELQHTTTSRQALRQARRVAQQITRVRGDATELRRILEDPESFEDSED